MAATQLEICIIIRKSVVRLPFISLFELVVEERSKSFSTPLYEFFEGGDIATFTRPSEGSFLSILYFKCIGENKCSVALRKSGIFQFSRQRVIHIVKLYHKKSQPRM